MNGQTGAGEGKKRGRGCRACRIIWFKNVRLYSVVSGAVGHRRAATTTSAVAAAKGELVERKVPSPNTAITQDIDVDHSAMSDAAAIGGEAFRI